jgi:hypothetical protein
VLNGSVRIAEHRRGRFGLGSPRCRGAAREIPVCSAVSGRQREYRAVQSRCRTPAPHEVMDRHLFPRRVWPFVPGHYTGRTRICPAPGQILSWHASRLPSGPPTTSNKSDSSGPGFSRSSAPSSTSTWQVAQLAERQENGMGSHWSSAISINGPPLGTSTDFWGPAPFDSTVIFGTESAYTSVTKDWQPKCSTAWLAYSFIDGSSAPPSRAAGAAPSTTGVADTRGFALPARRVEASTQVSV